MIYKSSILAAIFVLISIGNAIALLAPKVIAADLSDIENAITDRQSELIVNAPDLKLNTTNQHSASIAKARLLPVATTKTTTATELTLSPGESSASIAKARLRNLVAKESPTSDNLPTTQSDIIGSIKDQIKNKIHTIPHSIIATKEIKSESAISPNNQTELNTVNLLTNNTPSRFTEQRKIADANSELNAIEQWEINKSVTLTDLLLTPAPVQTIVQVPAQLPDSSISAPVIGTPKPVITKPTAPAIGTQKPMMTTTEPQKPVITSGADESIAKPIAPIIETQKPEPQNNEPKKWAVGVHTQFSTAGFIGVDAGYKFNPNLHARLGLNTVGFNLDYASQGINYKASFSPTNVHLLGDFFPFGGGLRLTGGLVFQGNQFNATGTPNSSAIPGGLPTQINLGGTNYNISDVGTVSSEGSFSNSVAPYLGLGFGTPLSPGLGFNFDAGVMFAGSARVKLRANIPSSVPANIQNDIRTSLAEQERRTNNDIGSFGVYPVISVGLSYAF
jgi:hypothetical protein